MVLSGDSDRAGADYVLYLFGVYPRSADIGGHCIYSGCGDWMSVRNSAVRVCRTDLWVWQYV